MKTINRRGLILGATALGLAGCASNTAPRILTYDGPEVTRVVVNKGARLLHLLSQDRTLRSYQIELGFSPEGPKRVEGDGKTPEGTYIVNRRNPQSQYHLSVGISYPDENDVARARALGASPGGDIFIHGTPRELRNARDWTAGCIAVSNREVEDIYAMVRDGTPVILTA